MRNKMKTFILKEDDSTTKQDNNLPTYDNPPRPPRRSDD